MCTYTLIQWPELGKGIRIVFNRDEVYTRQNAIPPLTSYFGNRLGISPIDGESGGSWIGVNDAGLTAALLNVNIETSLNKTRTGKLSRGIIIPRALRTTCTEDAIADIWKLDLNNFQPFRFVCTDAKTMATFIWDGHNMEKITYYLSASPFFFTSSGLGDSLVEPGRRLLFSEVFRNALQHELKNHQDYFHWHKWSELPEVSVCMKRKDACTVSITCIEVTPDGVSMDYVSIYPEWSTSPRIALRLNPTYATLNSGGTRNESA